MGKGQFHEVERSQKNIPALHFLVYIAFKIKPFKESLRRNVLVLLT